MVAFFDPNAFTQAGLPSSLTAAHVAAIAPLGTGA